MRENEESHVLCVKFLADSSKEPLHGSELLQESEVQLIKKIFSRTQSINE